MESGNRKLEPYLKAAFTEMKGTMTMTSEFEKAWIQPVTRKQLENCQEEGLVKECKAEQNRQKKARKDSGLKGELHLDQYVKLKSCTAIFQIYCDKNMSKAKENCAKASRESRDNTRKRKKKISKSINREK